MNVPFLDLKAGLKSIRAEVDAAVTGVFDRCDFVLGEAVSKLEREIAGYCGVPHAIAVASGTDALKVALRAFNVGPGDEVLTSPVTFIATAEAVCSMGAKPVFIDVCPETYNIDPAKISEYIDTVCETDPESGALKNKQSGARVAGIIPVHLFGQCADMDAINAIAEKHKMFVLEDACQAFGAGYKKDGALVKSGALGTAAAFSFYPSKNLGGAGDGGIIVTADAALAQSCRTLRVHGAVRAYDHTEHGFNSRLDTLQAVFVSVKLPHIDEWVSARRQRAATYARLFREAAEAGRISIKMSGGLNGAELPDSKTIVLPSEAANCDHSYGVYSVRVLKRDAMVDHLRAQGVGTHIYYPIALHVQKVYEDLGVKKGDMPVSEAICESVFSLPMYPELNEEQQKYVVETAVRFIEENA